jgi:adenylate cyclase
VDELFLEKEILKSEKLRTAILALNFLFLSLAWFTITIFSPVSLIKNINGSQAFVLPWIFALVALYFVLLRRLLQYFLDRGKSMPIWVQYLDVFIEVSFPTLIIIIGCNFYKPVTMLFMPPVLGYMIFIILSALTLRQMICIFAGFVAAFQYLCVCFYILNYTDISSVDPFLTNWYGVVSRTLILFVGGIATGFITGQIKKKMMAYFEAKKEVDRIESIFGQHVSPEVVAKLLSKDANASESLPVCIMFLDIRNFTHFTEQNSASVVVSYLNHIFDFMVEIIHDHKGIINKFLGDGFMAIFGAPITSGKDVKHAVQAALEIVKRTEADIKKGLLPDLKLGIALHFGQGITGTIGAKRRLEYTIVGDVVNSTAHIEQLNKKYHTQVLISEDALKEVPNLKSEYIGYATLKHRDEPIKLYKLV